MGTYASMREMYAATAKERDELKKELGGAKKSVVALGEELNRIMDQLHKTEEELELARKLNEGLKLDLRDALKEKGAVAKIAPTTHGDAVRAMNNEQIKEWFCTKIMNCQSCRFLEPWGCTLLRFLETPKGK